MRDRLSMSNRKVLKKVSAGFQVDMNTLFRKFTAEEIIRFAAFSKVWREMKFSLVFCGRVERELRLFFEEIVPAILQFWLPTSSFREKVFGLYMLYAVYALQPTFPRLKIRLRLSDWEQSEVLLRFATREQHLDICYILHRMRLEKCFHYVAHLRQRSPVMYNNQNEDGEDVSAFAALTGKVYTPLDKMAKRGTLQVLTMVHRKYLAVKAEQAEPEVRDLDIVKEDIYEDVRRQIFALQQKHGYRESQVAAGTSHKDKATSSKGEDDVAARRKALKAKRFRSMANTRKGKCFEQLMYDMAESVPGSPASISSTASSMVTAGTSHKDEATSSDEEDDVAARRKALKAKSFRCVANTRKGRRLEQLMHDMAEADPEYSVSTRVSTSSPEKRMRKQPPRAAKMAAENTYHCL